VAILVPLFLLVGALYASVGHAGASGYLAVMALVGIEATTMRPTALAVNVLVAAIAFVQFAREGHFSWRFFWPFAVASVPTAFVGGLVHLPVAALRVAIGLVLLVAAARMAWVALGPRRAGPTDHPTQPPALPVALGCGAILGFIAGLTGTGGGIFLSPIILLMGWAGSKRTAATAAPFILVNSLAGLGGVVQSGWRPPPALAALAVAACLGGALGSWLGSRWAPPWILNLLLAAVLLVAGGKLVWPSAS
jgi:uncharacterized membrane protein YfcA